ncbi:MAG: carbonic anhydrase [Nostocaceae cyanobacterium]|nr:carbonic anhydrase [Nostocaceae cyanobacterium]
MLKKPSQILLSLILGNDSFVEQHEHGYFEKFQNVQTPDITILTCSDSRVQLTLFEPDATNRVFVVRNIGNQLLGSFGSVDYGVKHLHTPVLLILGHVRCGAIKAALSDYGDEPFDIIRELDHLSIPLRHIKYPNQSPEMVWNAGVETNIDYQVNLAMKKYKSEFEAGLSIIGAVDDFTNSYKTGDGRLIIININGETDPEKIRSHEVLADIPDTLKQLHVKRLTD